MNQLKQSQQNAKAFLFKFREWQNKKKTYFMKAKREERLKLNSNAIKKRTNHKKIANYN